ncbi:hypothetical protein KIN20_009973 [Parelaphostrongylus tenuis]|uniref:C2H2-type domain-containing protein n=2 Tax=Parelaphostrongylus tenuis TaxID=148309 RepID=A0AAD5QLK4_PARTN|nr:hypothetical protein KIN20_009973 [Parelaphostrongylus tenuis]
MEAKETDSAERMVKIEREVEFNVPEDSGKALGNFSMSEMEVKWETVEDFENLNAAENSSVALKENGERKTHEEILKTNGTEKLNDCKWEVERELNKDLEYANTSKGLMLEYVDQEEDEVLEGTDDTGNLRVKVQWESIEDFESANTSGYSVPCEKEVKQEEYECDEYTVDRENLFEEEVKQEEVQAIEEADGTKEATVMYEEDAEESSRNRELEEKKIRKKKLREKRREKEKRLRMLKEKRREKKRKRELQRQAAISNKNLQLYCCFVCNKMFIDEETMRQHVLKKHIGYEKEYIFKCSKCYRRFKYQQHLRRHDRTHSDAEFTCFLCKREFREETSLRIHLSKVHNRSLDGSKLSKSIKCKCGQKFGLNEELSRHRYYCNNRENIAEQRRKAREEKLEATTSSSVSSTRSVSSCFDTASTPSVADTSVRPIKDKSCPFCFHVFASMQSRRRHIEQIHPERLHEIEVDQHLYIKINSPALPYVCELCAKAFSTHASLSVHKRRIHEDLNNHACTVCDKRYPLPSELKKHMKRVHSLEMET